MSISGTMVTMLYGSAMVAIVGCGAPELPPAGPAPDQVDIGYGTQAKGKVTGAVTSLSEKDIATARPLPIEDLLRGRVAGLQIIRGVGGRVTFRIRGLNSLQNNSEPLFVIDGVQVGSGSVHAALAGLTPSDIRQVDVLKDIASTSIYGTRGAGGVILITTKR